MALETSKNTTGDWNWRNKHVSDSAGAYQNAVAGATASVSISDFIDSSSTLLCAGPASLGDGINLNDGIAVNNGGSIPLVPIGLAMGIGLQINRQSSKIYEIGSRLGYTVSGRVAGGMSINRALLDGGNLLKVLYAGEVASDSSDGPDSSGVYQKTVVFRTGNSLERGLGGKKLSVPAIGSGNIALNLDSAFFNHPFGLALIMRSQTDQSVSQHFFEGCVITNYSINISAEMNVLTEGVQIEFTRIVPIITTATAPSTKDEALALRYAGDLADNPINPNGVIA